MAIPVPKKPGSSFYVYTSCDIMVCAMTSLCYPLVCYAQRLYYCGMSGSACESAHRACTQVCTLLQHDKQSYDVVCKCVSCVKTQPAVQSLSDVYEDLVHTRAFRGVYVSLSTNATHPGEDNGIHELRRPHIIRAWQR